MDSMGQLISALNANDFKAFPQKADPKKLTISAKGEDGNRYFITRRSIGVNEDGTAKYAWVKGNAWKS